MPLPGHVDHFLHRIRAAHTHASTHEIYEMITNQLTLRGLWSLAIPFGFRIG